MVGGWEAGMTPICTFIAFLHVFLTNVHVCFFYVMLLISK